MKKIFQITLLAGLAMGLHLFAEKVKDGTPYSPMKKPQIQQVDGLEPGYEVNSNSMAHGYSYPGRISVNDDWDFYTYLSFLYWQMIADGYDFIYHINTNTQRYDAVRFPHKWKPALKAGLAMTFHRHDDWQLLGEYLRYYSTTHVSAEKRPGAENVLRAVTWIFLFPIDVQSADGRLKVGIDAVNLSLGRPYYLGTKLIINPFFGIHAAWIHQEMNTNVYDLDDAPPGYVPGYFKSKSWSLGLRTGFDAKFLLGEGFRFFGKGACSLDYRRHHSSALAYRYLNPQYFLLNSSSRLRPELELGGGFGWGTYMDDYNYHLDLSAGYDMYLIYKEQNIMYDIWDYAFKFKPMNLCLHGLTITARLDF